MIYPWLEPTWMAFKNHYRQGYLPHALVITGVKGLGKHQLGKQLAQLILCELNLDEACGHCRQCHLFAAHSHPDFINIEPEEESRVIKIEQVRSLIDTLNQTPLVAKSQVVLMDPLEGMTLKAANALLKTLEEPLGNVFFILIAHRLTHIPVTLLSRCQLYSIHVSCDKQALQWLADELSCSQVQADVLLRLSHGAPLEALGLSKKNVMSQRDQLLRILQDKVSGHNSLPGIEALLKEYSEDVFAILRFILQDLRKCHLGVNVDKWANVDAAKQIQSLAAAIHPDQLQLQLETLDRAEKAFSAGIAINLQMALESLIIQA